MVNARRPKNICRDSRVISNTLFYLRLRNHIQNSKRLGKRRRVGQKGAGTYKIPQAYTIHGLLPIPTIAGVNTSMPNNPYGHTNKHKLQLNSPMLVRAKCIHSHGILSMRGFAKSLSTQDKIMASVKRTQYANRALLRITSLLANPQAWQAQVAAQEARADPSHEKANIFAVS